MEDMEGKKRSGVYPQEPNVAPIDLGVFTVLIVFLPFHPFFYFFFIFIFNFLREREI